MRCTMWAPTLTTCHITDGTTLRWWSPSARRLGITMARNTTALSTWAVTVPHALPAMPQSSPNTSSSSRTRLVVVANSSTTKGRLVSGSPYR